MAALDENLCMLGVIAGQGEKWPIGNSWVYSPDDNAWGELPNMPVGTERGASAMGVGRETIIKQANIEAELSFTSFYNVSRF